MRYAPLVCLALVAAPLAAHEDDPKILDKKPRVEGVAFRRTELFRSLRQSGSLDASAAGQLSTGQRGGSKAVVPGFSSNGITLQSWLPISEFGDDSSGNDCWGYTSPSGREYAIIGLSDSTAFVEVTDPGDAQVVSVQGGPSSLWRDIKTYQNFAYAVSEGGDGIQVFNLANIDAGVVSFLGTVTTGDSNTPATHNVQIDEVSGFLYRCGGGSNGLRFYSLANPANPTFVGSWDDRYVHDAQIVTYTSGPFAGRQIAFACSGFDGGFTNTGLDVIDVTNKNNPINLANVFYTSSAYSHQGWLSEDRQFFYLNDELDGQARTIVFNVSNINSPFQVTTYGHGNNAVTHNVYTRDGLAFHSNYTSGLQVFDLSNPTSPTEAFSFDTTPDISTETFNGLWSNYPYFPSGTVIGSDLESGLFVWRVGAPDLSYSFAAGLPDFVTPGSPLDIDFDLAEAGAALVPGSVELFVDTGAGFTSASVAGLGGNSYRGTLPAAGCGTAVRYFFAAEDASGVTWTSPGGAPSVTHVATAAVESSLLVEYDMESTQGWSAGAAGDDATTGIWERRNPNGTSAQPESDHTPGGGNTDCWVTGNDSSSLGSDDVDGGRTTLLSPVIDLSGADNATISYWRWYSNNASAEINADIFEVDISNNGGATWTSVEVVGPAGVESTGEVWYFHEFTVGDFVPLTSQIRMRFVASDEGGGSIVEAAVDDFSVTALGCASLSGNVASVSLGAGSSQALSLNAGEAFADERYWLVGSTSGTAPGLPLGGLTLPLNPDFYFNLTVAGPNLAPLGNSLGLLDGSGQATASFGLSPGTAATLAGVTVHHAFVVLDVVTDEVLFVSNAAPVLLVP